MLPTAGTIDATDTPRPIVGRLNREVRDILALPDIKLKLVEGGNIAIPSTPDEMRVRTASDMTRWRHVIEAANIQTE
jgi:tripartite-type tricarboxylate transporter receptor subunit TctC